MLVTAERIGAVSLITLNRPERMNAINCEVREALIEALRAANGDGDVRAVILTGAGERAFCAGQDLEESSKIEPLQIPAWLGHMRAMYQAIRDLDKGCVAAFNGITVGAGFQIGLCADLRVGYPDMAIGQPEVKVGLASITGSYLMSLHVGLGVNQTLSLMGDLVDGTRAYEMGLLTHLVPAQDVLATATELAEKLAAISPTVMRVTAVWHCFSTP